MTVARRQHKPHRDIAAERRALEMLSIAAQERAPAALRARLELARDPRPGWRPGRPLAAFAATAGVAAAALSTAVALLIGGGGPGAPTVAAAAALGARTQAVALHLRTGVPPGASAAGIAFPDWSTQFGLRTLGERDDHLGGRLATTLFYGNGRQRIAYTIVSGTSLPAGAASHSSVWGATRLETLSAGGRVIVSWVQDGHSCVLSATGTPVSTLARLASSEANPSVYG